MSSQFVFMLVILVVLLVFVGYVLSCERVDKGVVGGAAAGSQPSIPDKGQSPLLPAERPSDHPDASLPYNVADVIVPVEY